MMDMSTGTISIYVRVHVSVWFPDTLKQSSLWGEWGNLIKNGRKQKIGVFLLPHSASTFCLSRAQFPWIKEELERLVCSKKVFPTAIMNPHWRGQKVQQSRQLEAGWLTLRLPSLIWAAVVPGAVPQAAETTPEALRGSALVLQQKVTWNSGFWGEKPANLPVGPAREKGRAGQSPLLPPPQLTGESLLRLTLRIDDPGILGCSTPHSFRNTFLLLPGKQFFHLLGTDGFFQAHQSCWLQQGSMFLKQ